MILILAGARPNIKIRSCEVNGLRGKIWEEEEDDINVTDMIQAVTLMEEQMMNGNHSIWRTLLPGGC